MGRAWESGGFSTETRMLGRGRGGCAIGAIASRSLTSATPPSPVSGLSRVSYAVRAPTSDVCIRLHSGLQSYVFSRRHRSTLHAVIIPVRTEHTPETLAGGARPPSTTTINGRRHRRRPVNMNHNKDNHMRTHRPAASADNVASHAGVTHLLGGRAASSIAMRAGEGRPPRREARGPHFSRRV